MKIAALVMAFGMSFFGFSKDKEPALERDYQYKYEERYDRYDEDRREERYESQAENWSHHSNRRGNYKMGSYRQGGHCRSYRNR